MASTTKTFKSDDSVLDPAIKSHITTLYAAVDNQELEIWGAHFTEDAVLKKGTSNVKGRENLVELVTKSWSNFQSRDHTVYSVFPFGPKAEEVMMHGRSNNVSKDGQASTFTWAARMHFRRDEDGKVLIDHYTIITDPHPSTI
ncbi:fungal specific transcription factor [Ilyonectria robusta]